MTAARIVTALVAAAVLSLGAAAAAHAVTIGIADQKADMFSDPLFQAQGFRVARLQVPWDVRRDPVLRARFDDWMTGAHAASVRPLITFGPGSGRHGPRLPAPALLARQLRLIRHEYPWAREFSSWNEANHCGSLTCRRPALVAAYYRALRRSCSSCVILSAEVLDTRNMRAWVDRFTAALPPGLRRGIPWGLHNYVDTNRLQTAGTRTLLGATTGPVWLTETGGIVRRRNPHKVSFKESAAHAAIATRWLLTRIVPLSSRIRRVYVYHWNAQSHATWDSGLIAPDGTPRAAFRVLSAAIRRQALGVPRG